MYECQALLLMRISHNGKLQQKKKQYNLFTNPNGCHTEKSIKIGFRRTNFEPWKNYFLSIFLSTSNYRFPHLRSTDVSNSLVLIVKICHSILPTSA